MCDKLQNDSANTINSQCNSNYFAVLNSFFKKNLRVTRVRSVVAYDYTRFY